VGLPRQAHGWAGLWGAGDQPCCGIPGAGAGGAGGLKWGSGHGRGAPRGGQGQAGLGCSQTLAPIASQ